MDKTTSVLNTLLKVIIGASVSWCLFYFLYPDSGPAQAPVSGSIIYDSMALEIESLKEKNESLCDSLFAAYVEKGHVEIELNKSQSEVKRLISKNRVIKIKKDTIELLQNCDSIVLAVENDYIPLIDTLRDRFESILSIQRSKDSINTARLDAEYSLRRMVSDDLFKEKVNNDVLRSSIKKGKKKTFIASAGCFLAGLIGGILLIK